MYNLKDPVLRFPQDISGPVHVTVRSIGDIHAINLMGEASKDEHLKESESDSTDIGSVLDGSAQGMMKGSLVGNAIVGRYPKKLGMTRPWSVEPDFVSDWNGTPRTHERPLDYEVFAFPCRRGSGLASLLGVFIVQMMDSGELQRIAKRYGMNVDKMGRPVDSVSSRIKKSPRLPGAMQDLMAFSRSDLKLVKPGGKLVVSLYADFWPVAFKNDRGEMSGMDVDILDRFCEATGMTSVYRPRKKFDHIWKDPGKGDFHDAFCDVAAGGISIEPHRKSANVEWTFPYTGTRRTIVYNLKNPVLRFPQDVNGTIYGTMSSIGDIDAQILMNKGNKREHLRESERGDKKDMESLLDGSAQGLMRGSLVGRAIVGRYPKKLGMTDAWSTNPDLINVFLGTPRTHKQPLDYEAFAFPCRRGSGVAPLLSLFIVQLMHSGELQRIAHKYGMRVDKMGRPTD